MNGHTALLLIELQLYWTLFKLYEVDVQEWTQQQFGHQN